MLKIQDLYGLHVLSLAMSLQTDKLSHNTLLLLGGSDFEITAEGECMVIFPSCLLLLEAAQFSFLAAGIGCVGEMIGHKSVRCSWLPNLTEYHSENRLKKRIS